MKRRVVAVAATLAVLPLALGCTRGGEGNSAAATVLEAELSEAREIVTTDSLLLAAGRDVAVDAHGRIYVLDGRDAGVLRIDSSGAAIHLFGGLGEGPGEFHTPTDLGIDGDLIRVFDRRSGRIQAFALNDGSYVETVVPEGAAIALRAAIGPNGRLAYSGGTLAQAEGALAAVVDGAGTNRTLLGTPASDDPQLTPSLRTAVLQRSLPGFMRGHALPAFADDGTLAVIQHTEGLIELYGDDGDLLSSFALDVPEHDTAMDAFVDWYTPREAEGLNRLFEAVEDAVITEDGVIWLLWNLPRHQAPVITVSDREGTTVARLHLTGVQTELRYEAPDIAPRRYFAVDTARERILLLNVTTVTEIPFRGLVPNASSAEAQED